MRTFFYPSRERFRIFLTLPILAVLVSCASSAPPLPEDTTSSNRQHSLSLSDFASNDAAMDCASIREEQSTNNAKIDQDNDVIKSNRRRNEVAGYFAALTIVPLVATESNDTERDDITVLQKRQDTLLKLAAVKKCPA